jgi:hypothetical protein
MQEDVTREVTPRIAGIGPQSANGGWIPVNRPGEGIWPWGAPGGGRSEGISPSPNPVLDRFDPLDHFLSQPVVVGLEFPADWPEIRRQGLDAIDRLLEQHPHLAGEVFVALGHLATEIVPEGDNLLPEVVPHGDNLLTEIDSDLADLPAEVVPDVADLPPEVVADFANLPAEVISDLADLPPEVSHAKLDGAQSGLDAVQSCSNCREPCFNHGDREDDDDSIVRQGCKWQNVYPTARQNRAHLRRGRAIGCRICNLPPGRVAETEGQPVARPTGCRGLADWRPRVMPRPVPSL